jgi:hypothetical protein
MSVAKIAFDPTESRFSMLRERVTSELATGVFRKLGGEFARRAAKQLCPVGIKPETVLTGNSFRPPLSRCTRLCLCRSANARTLCQ